MYPNTLSHGASVRNKHKHVLNHVNVIVRPLHSRSEKLREISLSYNHKNAKHFDANMSQHTIFEWIKQCLNF